ncbi:28640_t:CDS:2, partial [Gigaspora margarita]
FSFRFQIYLYIEAEIQQQLQVVAQDVSPKDRNIAKWLELKEKVLFNRLDFEQKGKEEFEENKEVLIIMECGVPDYGTKKIKGKIMQAKGIELAKQDDLTERIIANIKQMEVDINIDNKTKVVDKTSNKMDKVEDISSSIWAQDVLTYTRAIHIKKALSFYGKILIHGAVHFEKDKMLRLTQSRFDKETLVERSKLKAILKNLPKSTIELALLRQLKSCKAKVVYVSHNSNGNQRGTASVYFESKKDLDNALTSTVWYYDTKLEWINRRGCLNQGIQGAEVNAEAGKNIKPKSAKRNNFSRKKGKERLDRVLVKEDLKYRLVVAPSEVLLDTKNYFKGQFRERCPKIKYMTKDWKAVYSPVKKVQESWYDSTLGLVELEK